LLGTALGALAIACGARTGLGVVGLGGANESSSSATASSTTGAIEPCPVGCAMGTPTFPPAVHLLPPELPLDCLGGFEENNTEGSFVATALSPAGAHTITLDVEIATYKAPDHVRITGVDATDATYVLVDLCDLRTALYSDPTNGCTRPPEDSIRQYLVEVTEGTKSLTFDTTGACTPFYLRVLGLCDFQVAPPVPGCGFRLIP
jgi:hypothetical protein